MKLRKRIIIFSISLSLLSLCAGCVPDQYEPEEGVWFCEDLQIQLSYEKNPQTFLIENGEIIACACGSDKGMPYLSVSCQEKNHPKYRLAEEIFYAKIISLSKTEFTVYDEQAERYYTFLRIYPVS